MGVWKKALVHVAWGGLIMGGFLGAILPAGAQRASVVEHQEASVQNQVNDSSLDNLADPPNSPGALAGSIEAGQKKGSSELRRELASSMPLPAVAQAQNSSSDPQAAAQKPVGTAAAEAPNASGVAASQPAGVAIAPAKQRRVRTIVLRMGAIVGAGVAVGTVVALTAATPSKPPGAH